MTLHETVPPPEPDGSPANPRPLAKYLSFGWGVQSWTIAAMIALGKLPPVDAAIHADTRHERLETYEHARKWTPWLEERGVKVVTVYGDRTDIVRPDWSIGSVMIPAFTQDRQDGSHGQVKRQCTHDWKITPIRRYIKTLLPKGRPKPGSVESWQGISLDEWQRMRSSDVAYITNIYPLVDLRMTRAECARWLQDHGLDIPPKSACVFCPFHSIQSWKDLKRRGGPDWEHAVETDETIRNMRDHHTLYIHPYRKPLEKAIQIPEDQGVTQLGLDLEQPCDGGHCFV